MSPFVNVATRAARNAAKVVMRYLGRIDDLSIELKSKNDFVSQVDRQAEAEIIQVLQETYPAHAILAEESGDNGNDSEYQWIIDPLDGTTNYLHGFPQFAISIGLLHKNRLTAGVVFDPLRNELFTAARGEGAHLNERRIRVTPQRGLEGALIGTGFPFRQQEHLETYLDTFRAIHKDTAGIRRAGSAALDLCYVAAGRLDGFWELGLSPWDMAAGVLIIREAGGIVTDFSGEGHYLETGNVIAATPKVYQPMFEAIKPHLTPDLK